MADIYGVADYYSDLDYADEDYTIDAPSAAFTSTQSGEIGGLLLLGTGNLVTAFVLSADYGLIRGSATIQLSPAGTLTVTPAVIADASVNLSASTTLTTIAAGDSIGSATLTSAFAQTAAAQLTLEDAALTVSSAFSQDSQAVLDLIADATLSVQAQQTQTAELIADGRATIDALFTKLTTGQLFVNDTYRTYRIPAETRVLMVHRNRR